MSEKAWDEPGVEQVLDGVFRIPLPLPNDGLRAVNVYAIADGDGLVLIDAGWALDREPASNSNAAWPRSSYKLADIREFLVTHAHRDHYTQAITIRRLFGTQVQIGAGERAIARELASARPTAVRHELSRAARPSRRRRAGRPDPADWPRREHGEHDGLGAARRLAHPGPAGAGIAHARGDRDPGPHPGHVVFHDLAAAALFAGDHVLPRITPSIGLEPGGSDAAAGGLPRLAAPGAARCPDARLLPAHGPVTDSVHARVEELLAHHEQRLTASRGRGRRRARHGLRGRQDPALDPPRTRLDDLDLFNQIAGDRRDPGAPGRLRRPRLADAARPTPTASCTTSAPEPTAG